MLLRSKSLYRGGHASNNLARIPLGCPKIRRALDRHHGLEITGSSQIEDRSGRCNGKLQRKGRVWGRIPCNFSTTTYPRRTISFNKNNQQLVGIRVESDERAMLKYAALKHNRSQPRGGSQRLSAARGARARTNSCE